MTHQDDLPLEPFEPSFEPLDEPFELRKFSIVDTLSKDSVGDGCTASRFSLSDGGSTFRSSSDPTLCGRPESKESKASLDHDGSENDPYQHLPVHEATILRTQIITPEANAGITTLYRYASKNDIMIIIISALASIAAGAALPLATIVFGSIQSSFQGFFLGQISSSEFTHHVSSLILRFVYLAIAEFVTTYVGTVGFIYTGERISAKIRQHYLQSCIRQNIGYFDKLGAGEVTTRITDDMNLVQEGISEKVSVTLTSLAAFVSAFVIGFVLDWKLTLILSSTIVALFLVVGIATKFIVKYTKQSIEAYASGGTIVEEALSSIRTSVAFGTESRLAQQYDRYLKHAESFSFKSSSSVAFMFAGMMLVIYLNYGLSFWVGSKYIVEGSVPLSKVLTSELILRFVVFPFNLMLETYVVAGILLFTSSDSSYDKKLTSGSLVMLSIVVGAFNLGNVAPNLQAFGTALAACEKVFNTIDRHSPLDPMVDEGGELDYVKGALLLKNVRHVYPSRPDVTVLDDITLDIPSGKTTALVGASGSGKSTIVGLIERFYTPVSGHIYVDGYDISSLNLRWWRQQISLVSQEPVLFDTTIFNNILYGLPDYSTGDSLNMEKLVTKAARKANAHDFISLLPEGYQTNVGERGFLLSGGQKQRIAIARAIISNPKILLLDEATSALDTSSEEVVQAALEAASEGRTTITIAHRLSTIKKAHNIAVMSKGSIVEQGTHNHLLAKRGAYYNLVKAQSLEVGRSASVQKRRTSSSRRMRNSVQPGGHGDLVARESFAPSPLSPSSGWRNSGISAMLHRLSEISALSRVSGSHTYDEFDADFKYHDQLNRRSQVGTSSVYSQNSTLGELIQRNPSERNSVSTYSRYSGVDVQDQQLHGMTEEMTEEKGYQDKEVQYGFWTLVRFVARFNKQEWMLMIWGLFWAIICGSGNPVHAFLFAKQVLTLSMPISSDNRHEVKNRSDFWSLMYLVLALVIFVAQIGQGTAFARCSAILIHRVRDQAFRTMLRQDVAFFDENTTGALTSFLSTEATHVAGLSGATLGTLLTVMTTLISSIAVALVFGWKLALVCTATVPVILACGFFRFYMLTHFQKRSKKAYEHSASYASEAISSIRTVASLTREAEVLQHYKQILTSQQRSSLISVAKSSLLYAASQSFLFLAFALGFWYGSQLIARHEYDLFHFFVCFIAVIYGAQSAGSVFSFAPDMGKTYQAANKLKTLFEQRPSIDTWSQDDKEKVQAIQGAIQLRDIHFQYPTRPGPVLSGLSLMVQPNQYVALVGPSGCGKSTTISLLERFYDPSSGTIYVDEKDIRNLDVNDYRSFIALVSQEPMLYQGTIKENILLGTSTDIPDHDVESACREANIYDFILSLPDGFDTVVGSKGVLLSGGQKQCIAIARALVRNPRILLLDEATSALDSESEHVVQAALENASRGRTTIAVAHRLSTVKRADIIYVFDQGRIVEQGTHSGLMRRRNGRYAELVRHQKLEEDI
ncbi:P-loop containing nucleoside triphosphate hydrolase protein [Xylaria curta]|nr:P-loop containing nucleoside triphosphate hydrolase protein [Xylaria curta]